MAATPSGAGCDDARTPTFPVTPSLYYERGNPRAVIFPDLYVVFGVEKRPRDSYKAWEEGGILPAFVLEVTSNSTRQVDQETMFQRYEQVLKVPEYFLFDPREEYLEPRLQGYRLIGDRYARIEAREAERGIGAEIRTSTTLRLYSEQLGMEIGFEGSALRFYDPATGQQLRSSDELAEQLEVEEAARAFAERRAAAEAQRAETEAQLANEERQHAAIEAQGRAEAEAELARLRTALETLRRERGKFRDSIPSRIRKRKKKGPDIHANVRPERFVMSKALVSK